MVDSILRGVEIGIGPRRTRQAQKDKEKDQSTVSHFHIFTLVVVLTLFLYNIWLEDIYDWVSISYKWQLPVVTTGKLTGTVSALMRWCSKIYGCCLLTRGLTTKLRFFFLWNLFMFFCCFYHHLLVTMSNSYSLLKKEKGQMLIDRVIVVIITEVRIGDHHIWFVRLFMCKCWGNPACWEFPLDLWQSLVSWIRKTDSYWFTVSDKFFTVINTVL